MLSFALRLHRWIPFSLLLIQSAHSTLTNRTIDDENGDSESGLRPIYAPTADAWNYGPACPGCYVQPNPDDTFDQSWHDVTVSPTDSSLRNVTLTFNGTAIWVYGVVPNYVQYATTYVNVTFEMDGHKVGVYSHIPSTSDTYIYNVTMYQNTSLQNGLHTLVISPQGIGAANASYMSFDWAEYTYDSDFVLPTSSSSAASGSPTTNPGTPTSSGSPPPSRTTTNLIKSSSPPVGAIVGGVVGGVAALAIAFAAFFFWRRRGRQGADRIYQMGGSDDLVEPMAPADAGRKFEPYSDSPSGSHVVLSSVGPSVDPSMTQSPAASAILSPRFFPTNGSVNSAAASSVPPSSTVPSSAARTVTTTTDAASSGRSRQSKAALRRDELSRQMRDIERHVADLQRRQSSAGRTESTPRPAVSREQPAPYDDSDLRRQIETLQLEVERLRMEAEAAQEPPPAYEEEEEEDGPNDEPEVIERESLQGQGTHMR